MKRKSLNILLLLVFAPLFAALALYNIFAPKTAFSENENRYLERFPSFSVEALLSGEFTRDLDSYLSDHFVFRDSWIAVQSTSEQLLGKRKLGGVWIAGDSLMSHIAQPDAALTAANISGINSFCEQYPQLNAYMMLVPSADYVQRYALPVFASNWNQQEWISSVYSQLSTANGVNLCELLQENSAKYIYYRTDHHWTTYGAYLAYEQFCELAEIGVRDLKLDYVCDGFSGTLFSSSGVRSVQPDVLFAYHPGNAQGLSVFDGAKTTEYDSIYFEDFLAKKDKYSYFLGSNQTVVTIHADSGTGRSIVIFKDSYAHCFAPMLCEQYDTITLVDLRYISGPVAEVVDPSDYDDVLFLYSVDTFSHQAGTSRLGA